MYANLRMHWPSAALDVATLARRLLMLATETQFVEIGLDASGRGARFDMAKDTVSSIRRALEDAMESDDPDARDEIAARLSALLHAIEDEGLSLTATVEQRAVEGAAGVVWIDVMSIVVEHRSTAEQPARAARREPAATAA